MLAAAGNALLAATRDHRLIKDKVREIERLPQLPVDELLTRYATSAPALYWLPGVLRVEGDDAILTFTLAGVGRNVAGPDQAFQGDGQDIGVDHLLLLAIRAIHGHSMGGSSWKLLRAELVDDPIFDDAGVAAIEMTFESSRIELASDWDIGELADFKTFHADIDIAPMAGEVEYQSWLQTPPNFDNSRPDAQLHVSLPGASP